MGAKAASGDLEARVEALSSRRLALLTGFFVLALAALLFAKMRDEAGARRIETQLRTERTAADCAGAMNLSIMTGASVRKTLAECHPGGSAAIFHVSANGAVLAEFGAVDAAPLT
ncbi:MAG: hypothetical protein AAGJ87_14320, partial [Pseudomonadota bacterium]